MTCLEVNPAPKNKASFRGRTDIGHNFNELWREAEESAPPIATTAKYYSLEKLLAHAWLAAEPILRRLRLRMGVFCGGE